MEIDRITPTQRPQDRVVMRQKWKNLLFLHWQVDPDALRALVPAELDLDLFEGQAYVGLVPFTMTGVRPVWSPPIKPISDFHETNVRTYVHLKGEAPGVWFFSLDAASSLAVRIARTVWHLPYFRAQMTMRPYPAGANDTVQYDSQRLWPEPKEARVQVNYTPCGAPSPATPGTLEHFLAERYLLYARRNGSFYRGQVHHVPYPLQSAKVHKLEETMLAAAGVFKLHHDNEPLVHYASEVDVLIYQLHRLSLAAERNGENHS